MGRRLQQGLRRDESGEQLILPMRSISESHPLEEDDATMPSLDSQEFAGEYVDRNGQTKKMYVSKMPLPQKNYKRYGESNNRELERLQGYRHDKLSQKKEVSDAIPDAERDKDEDRKAWRRTTKELNHRMLYFNHTHNAPFADMDSQRSAMYDGYNLKQLRFANPALEHTWRAQRMSAVPMSADVNVAAVPNVVDAARITLTRKDGPAFARVANPTPVAARHAQISLPFLPEATLRASSVTSAPRGEHIIPQKPRAPNIGPSQTQRNTRVDNEVLPTDVVTQASSPRPDEPQAQAQYRESEALAVVDRISSVDMQITRNCRSRASRRRGQSRDRRVYSVACDDGHGFDDRRRRALT